MKLRLLVLTSMLGIFGACSKIDVPMPENTKTEKVSSLSSGEIRDRALRVLSGSESVDDIKSYFSLFGKDTFRATKVSSDDSDKLSLFLIKHNMTIDSLVDYLAQNPSEVESVVKSTTSQAFYNAFIKVLSSPNKNSCIEDILSNRSLNSVEKGTLVLLLVDGEDKELRSFASCARRYARLAVIASKATAIAFIDIESASEYASRELKRMRESGEYVC